MDTVERSASVMTLDSRKTLKLTGVEDILSFDETLLTLKTTCGRLEIEGEKLHIAQFLPSTGEISLDGRINALFYTAENDRKKRSLFGR